MNVQYINPFLAAGFSVLELVLGETPQKGALGIQQVSTTTAEVNTLIGVTGAVSGSIVYGFSLETALKVAGKMTLREMADLDPLAKSAISELCNMISGHAMVQLSEAGFVCDITPPNLIRGQDVEVSFAVLPALLVPIETTFGEILITVGLQAAK